MPCISGRYWAFCCDLLLFNNASTDNILFVVDIVDKTYLVLLRAVLIRLAGGSTHCAGMIRGIISKGIKRSVPASLP